MAEKSKVFNPANYRSQRQSSGFGVAWTGIKFWVYLIGSALLLVFISFIFWPLISKIDHLKDTKEQLETQVGIAQDQNKSIAEEQLLLQKDPSYIEAKARDELNMGKPGEVIFRFNE